MTRLDEIKARAKAPAPVIALDDDHSFAWDGVRYSVAREHRDLLAYAQADRQYLLEQVRAMSDALFGVAEYDRNVADGMGCDAGNWDGGSADACEHCQLLLRAERLEALAALESEATQ